MVYSRTQQLVLCALVLVASAAGVAAQFGEAVLKPGNDGSTSCDAWLRQDGIYKTCDCIPGMTYNSTGTSSSNWCVPCSTPYYCSGGGAANPLATPSSCPDGLVTISAGAKSETQCYTAGGFGRSTTLLSNGTAVVVSVLCPVGTYNSGGNTAGCQQCGPGLTTTAAGSTSISHDGFTTAGTGSNSSAQCDRVMPGYFIVNATYAAPCPLGSYQGSEGTVYSCNSCPFGYITRDDGAGGNAECLAPPGWELKEGAAVITECEPGFYKEGWNKNPCLTCGIGLTTLKNGSVSVDQCRIKPGWGIKTFVPLEAEMCNNSRYGDPEPRPVVASARCVPCTINLFTLDVLTGNATTTGYISEQDCITKPGWGLEISGIVAMCQEGLFNEGFNRQPCRECDAGFTSVETGSDSPTACVVRSGWSVDAKSGLPKPCDAGTFGTGGTAENVGGSCTACPTGFSTQKDESVAAEECSVCAAGYGGVNCTACGHNTYSTGGQAEGTECMPCAVGSVSARKAIDSAHCLAAMVDADNDYFPLSDDSHWTDDGSKNSVACSESCRTNTLCAMYRFTNGQGSPKCQLLLEVDSGSRIIAFKADRGADYALYKVSETLTVGVQVSDAGSVTPKACMAACTSSGACELVSMAAANLPDTAGPCVLYGSQLEPEWTGMYHIQGSRLYTDSLISA
ncbi:hypothetical protein OEZ85_007160 [Tetradesmus obliquus]|uniref:Tyrosine-protein kinase ephrin type A/B receptor-like domain-containing protein n=1 Tax=Tetradesmus obliquus TaxID=3088 RepID=A0ABY8TXJ4_TETOB|nr:hypothetical protein OEZ85_007160 [Tetradesmus obliquus]